MLHDSVTNASSNQPNFLSHNSDSSNLQSGSRRASGGRIPKAELSERSVLSPAKGGTRWRLNGNGQLVDSTMANWEISDEIGKMHIGANGDGADAHIHTTPPSKLNTASILQLHEASPLETSSEASLDSGSSNTLDHSSNLISHSRESSVDTSASALSSTSQTLKAAPLTPLKVGAVGESRNRPHSYSGGLSSTDLTRLQQAGSSPASKGDSWTSPNGTPERQPQVEQPTFPSLATHGTNPRPHDQQLSQMISPAPKADDFQIDYTLQQRQYSPLSQGAGAVQTGSSAPFNQGRPNNAAANMAYRQPPRPFNPQAQVPPVMQSPTNFGYPLPPMPPMNNPQQQMFDVNVMLPTPPIDNPAMARLQQQHGVFRGAHQHSSSDPATVRDPAALALLNSNIQAFTAGQMYPPALPPALSMFAGQYYGTPQDAFSAPAPDLAAAQMMLRLQQTQYSAPYGTLPMPGQNVVVSNSAPSPPAGQGAGLGASGTGPSANNRKLGLYKTELCRSWEEKGTCRYGAKCQFAHGEEELRKVTRHPKYKTEICRTFWVSGSCPYGKRCCFIHTELPASGAAPGADGAPPPPNLSGRDRSGSTNSDPNEVSTSLLARISAKRNQEESMRSNTGNLSTTPPSNGFQVGGRPGGLRLDTSVVDTAVSSKQNKSAYPTFAHNGILLPTGEEPTARSPGPVTADPDFGRHASARLDIVGAQPRIGGRTSSSNSNIRHSFNGSDMQLDFSTTPTATNVQTPIATETPRSSVRINGHVRSGSAGNWGGATRSNLSYPLSSIPGGELKNNSPWGGDYAVGSRLAEKNWV